MAANMRGLNIFLSDIRACKTKDAEEERVFKEMAHIRSKFKAGKLSSYDKKKYICKLLYMYLLGYEVDFGLMECVKMFSSGKFSEKQIGYLALTLMLNENDDLIRLVVNSIRKDLNDQNEAITCLALHTIANICSRDMAEGLAMPVYQLFTSRRASTFVRKKAALALLRLFRKFPDLLPVKEWANSIVERIDDDDSGVVLSTTTLLLGLVQSDTGGFEASVGKAVEKLYAIAVQRRYSPDCVYYKVPAPWLQMKLLRLLRVFSPISDPYYHPKLQTILESILESSREHIKNQQHSNIQNAILVDAVHLGFANSMSSSWQRDSVTLLCKFVASTETNLRYLGLEMLGLIASSEEAIRAIQSNQDVILKRLADKDISVRRRALDLIYQSCDGSNAQSVVERLLEYLRTAEMAIREELVLKIAVLAEKYAADLSWYLDILLKLMHTAGQNVSDAVWYRVAQLIVSKPALQRYASERLLEYLAQPDCKDIVLKLAAFTLGEFGHLIADLPSRLPFDQLEVLLASLPTCSPSAKYLILSALFKLACNFPEIKPGILHALEEQTSSFDPETQQRASEYLFLLRLNDERVLSIVSEEMPPFSEVGKNPVLSRLDKRFEDVGSVNTRQSKLVTNG